MTPYTYPGCKLSEIQILKAKSEIFRSSKNRILERFEIETCISVIDLRKRVRKTELTVLRKILSYLLFKKAQMFYSEIARLLYRNHSTIIYYIDCVNEWKPSKNAYELHLLKKIESEL